MAAASRAAVSGTRGSVVGEACRTERRYAGVPLLALNRLLLNWRSGGAALALGQPARRPIVWPGRLALVVPTHVAALPFALL